MFKAFISKSVFSVLFLGFSFFSLVSCSEDDASVHNVFITDSNGGYAVEGDLLVAQYEVKDATADYNIYVRWLRNGNPIGGASSNYYILKADDTPTEISFQVVIKKIDPNNYYITGGAQHAFQSETPVTSNAIAAGTPPKVTGFAFFLDVNSNAIIDEGDQLTVSFDQAVSVNSANVSDFNLPVVGDDFGVGATVSSGLAENQVTITLGNSPCLTILGDYSGNTDASSPSGLDLSSEMIPDVIKGSSGVNALASGAVDIIPAFINSTQLLGSVYTLSRDMAVGDIDGDGDLDLVYSGGMISYFNDGQGNYTTGQVLGIHGYEVNLGDLDEDGDLDLVVDDQVYLNDGAGYFTDSGQEFGTAPFWSSAIGDIDSDGDLDIVYAASGGIRVYINGGAAIFTASGQSLGNWRTVDVALGDIDSDGDLDIVVANRFGEANRIYFNNGSGVFTDSTQILGANDSRSLALGDVDNDGDLDIAFANAYNEPNKIYINNGAGSFSNSEQLLGEKDSQSVMLGDLDNDGDLDLVFANISEYFGAGDQIYLNDGNGLYSDSGQSHSGWVFGNYGSEKVLLGDVDGDSDLDVFVAISSDEIQVFLGSFTSPHPD